MNIQKVTADDQLMLARPAMSLPEVSSPRSNPLTMIWRRRGIVVIVTLFCVAAAMVKYLFSDPIFQSEAKLYVTTSGLKSGVDGSSSTSVLHTQCELIKSSKIITDVLASPKLDNMKTFENQRGTTLRRDLDATVVKESDLITVTFKSAYPKEAQEVLKVVVDTYEGFHTKEKTARVFGLEQWREKSQKQLETRQKEMVAFKQKNGAISFTGEKGNIVLQKLASLQDAVTAAHVENVNARSALDHAKEMLSTPEKLRQLVEYLRATGQAISTDSNEQSLRSQLMAMDQQYQALQGRYLPDHPAVRAAQATMASLKARIDELDRSLAMAHVAALEQKVIAAKNKEKELQESYDAQQKLAMQLNATAAEYEVLEQDVKRLASAVEKADMQIIDLKASENVGVPNVQVFDEPNVPSAPIKPVRNVMLFQGLILGLLFGCMAALIRDWTDQGMRSAEEITQTVGIALLGSVPHIPGPPNPMAHGRKVDFEPASDVAETYRTIRTAVFFGTPDRESRTILVTSPAPGDGKSTFASNLAIAMAQTGKRILLIDADFRRPVQHRVFECSPGLGLSSVLTGKESLDKAVQATGIAGLDILPAGPVPSNPSEILNSQSFNEVLEELSVRYDHVVIDSPPVMAVADARILAAMCSVTILVLRAETSTRRAAVHTRKALESVGAHILGVVVNDVPRARDRHGDYGGYATYRSKYNGQGNGTPQPPANAPNAQTTAIVPAQSFLDLRRR